MKIKCVKDILKGKVVIVGIGNILRNDDAIGPAIIERLQEDQKAVYINAGVSLENYIGKITKEKPDTVLIVDAIHLGLMPGDYDILTKEDLLIYGFTTHDISPVRVIDFLEKETKAKIYLLGIQPENVLFGNTMSDVAKQAVAQISESINKSLATTRGCQNRSGTSTLQRP